MPENTRVLNKPPGTLINFGEKFDARHVYSNHLFYLNLKHFLITPFVINAFLRKIIKKKKNFLITAIQTRSFVYLWIYFMSILLLYDIEKSMHQFPSKKNYRLLEIFSTDFTWKLKFQRKGSYIYDVRLKMQNFNQKCKIKIHFLYPQALLPCRFCLPPLLNCLHHRFLHHILLLNSPSLLCVVLQLRCLGSKFHVGSTIPAWLPILCLDSTCCSEVFRNR